MEKTHKVHKNRKKSLKVGECVLCTKNRKKTV